ncbi:hypothetical protein GCM10027443_33190 [Pontibacter brevis]
MTSIESAALEKTAEAAKGIFDKLFGPTFEEFGLMIGDNIKVRRLKNQLKNFQKIEKIVADNNITVKQVDLKVLVPYLENVSLEENEDLQDMWANLMANYIDSAKVFATTVYPGIVSQLSTEEVRILNSLRERRDKYYRELYPGYAEMNPEPPEVIDRTPLLNLMRLNLVEEVHEIEQSEKPHFLTRAPELQVKYKSTNRFKLTEFGMSLLVACER